MSTRYFIGKDGVIEREVQGAELGSLAPLATQRMSFFAIPVAKRSKDFGTGYVEAEFWTFIGNFYAGYDFHGHYGDLIVVEETKKNHRNYAIITSIAERAWPKAANAADVIPIITDGKNIWFVFIRRKDNHKIAFIGGHLDVKGEYLETPAVACQHEAMEEAGLEFRPFAEYADRFNHEPNADGLRVEVMIKEIGNQDCRLKLLGTFETDEDYPRAQEARKKRKNPENRIYWTTAYSFIIRLDAPVTAEQIKGWFKPGDDAEEIIIHRHGDPIPDFAFNHHLTIFLQI